MSIYYPSCNQITPPTCSDCPTVELAGVRSVWFQKETFAFADITDPLEWQAAICSGDVIIIPKTRGSFESAESLENGYGDISQSVNGYDHTLNYFDPNFIGSCDFYNVIKKSSEYKVGWRSETQIYLSDKVVLVIPKFPIAEDVKSRIVFNVQVKFAQEDLPCPVDMPVGTFKRCIAC